MASTTSKPAAAAASSSEDDNLNDPTPLIIGLSMPQAQADAHVLLQQCREDGYDYCTTVLPLMSSSSTSQEEQQQQQQQPIIRTDVTILESHWWHTAVVGVMPTNNNNNNIPDNTTSESSTIKTTHSYDTSWWTRPLEWAWHMSLPAVILPPLPLPIHNNNNNNNNTCNDTDDLYEYARGVLTAAAHAKRANSHLWVPLGLHPTALQQWILFYKLVQYHPNVGILLELDVAPPPPPPPTSAVAGGNSAAVVVATTTALHLQQQLQLLHAMIGQGMIRAICFHCNGHFLTNKVGYPTLSKYHQTLLVFLLRRIGTRLRLLVQGPAAHVLSGGSGAGSGGGAANAAAAAAAVGPQALAVCGRTLCKPYLQYLNHVRTKRPEVRALLDTVQARMEMDYLDVLQRPLQPLKDNLENQTYEVFEKDPIKYAEYQRAIQMALQDFCSNASTKKQKSTCVVCVLGAGRGPLVQAVLNAYAALAPASTNSKQKQQQQQQQQSSQGGRPAELIIWAIEKNPSAILYLQSLAQKHHDTWGGGGSSGTGAAGTRTSTVKVLQADVRYVTRDLLQNQQADIVVSELLGSFGDNELSPECLNAFYGTSACHKDTISIPSRYTAFVAPVASVKLHHKALQQALYPNDEESGIVTQQVALETPYVVRSYDASQMHPSQACWSFVHPQGGGGGGGATNDTTGAAMNGATRFVELNFGPPDTSSAVYGSGFGPLDDQIIAASHATAAAVANTAGGETPVPTLLLPQPWTMSGLLGTFEAVLYYRPHTKELVQISTNPSTFSVGMFSWFPLYFPLLEAPILVPAGASVRVHLWRRVDQVGGGGGSSSSSGKNANQSGSSRIWYEWAVTVYRTIAMTTPNNANGMPHHREEILSVTPIHNPEGRSYHVSMN